MLHHYLLKLLPQFRDEVKLFYEIGVGCGMYSRNAGIPRRRGELATTSVPSLGIYGTSRPGARLWRSLCHSEPGHHCPAHRGKGRLDHQPEVLEHLEDPPPFYADFGRPPARRLGLHHGRSMPLIPIISTVIALPAKCDSRLKTRAGKCSMNRSI